MDLNPSSATYKLYDLGQFTYPQYLRIKLNNSYQLTYIKCKCHKQKITSVGGDIEKLELWCTIDGKVKWYSVVENNMAVLQKFKNRISI